MRDGYGAKSSGQWRRVALFARAAVGDTHHELQHGTEEHRTLNGNEQERGEPSGILPCLKEPAWSGRDDVCRPLWNGVESAHIPWLAFGYDHPHSFEFLGRARLEEMKKTERDVEREAIRNLRLRKATWHPTQVKLGFLKKLKMLICGDDYFAAEKILDQGFMREGQAKLGASLLAVGIPRRGFMIATDGKQPMDRLGVFAGAVSTQYQRADSPPITPAIFAVMDGKIVGMLQGAEEVGKGVVEREAESPGEDGAFLQSLVVANEETGLEEVHICAGGADLGKLGQAIEDAFRQTLVQHLPRKEFGGGIRVVILVDMTPEVIRRQLSSLEEHLRGTVAETRVKTVSGRPVAVTFQEDRSAI
jgi:uncharacterized protein YtpQ (UPF0354 family)